MRFLIAVFFTSLTILANAQTFSGVGGMIPDASAPVDFIIPVSGVSTSLGASAGLKTICINITHSYVSDLKASVIAPDGTEIKLFTNIGGDDDNFTNTCFDSSAAISINSGSAPFTGTFRPQGNIGAVNNGQNGNGNWILRIQDIEPFDIGYLNTWSITFGANAPTPTVIITDIPLVVINTTSALTGAYSLAQMKIIDNGAGNVHQPSDVGNVYSGNVNIRIRGSFSSVLPQKPYAFTTLGSSTTVDTNVSLLGMPKEHDWILLATYNDKSFVRNPMMYEIYRDMGHYAARSRYVEVVLDGEYQGIYSLMEKIKRDSQRVDIPKVLPTDTSGDELTGGYIIKHDYIKDGWESYYKAQPCNEPYTFNYEYPSANNIQPKQAAYIEDYFTRLEHRLFSPQYAHPVNGYRPMLHINSFVDYMLANEAAWNDDGYKKSMYFWKKKNSKDSTLHAGPIWDFDWALKRMPWTSLDMSGWYYTIDPCEGDVLFLPWWNIMMSDTFFANVAKCRWEFHRKYALNTDTIFKYIDKQITYLANAQQRHYNYWQTLGINVGTPEAAPYAQTLAEEIDTLKATLKRRLEWIDNNLQGTCYQEIYPAAIDDLSVNDIRLYPNPTTGTVNIESPYTISNVQVLCLDGRLLEQHNIIQKSKYQIDLTKFGVGLYIVLVRCGERQFIQKVNVVE